jgi:hypothetical protein
MPVSYGLYFGEVTKNWQSRILSALLFAEGESGQIIFLSSSGMR